ncbi:hypothetical protein BDZ97DRAFT_1741306 [Flammula alnicola]|nr:hypothetical protein BDZ97DRAFT_1741306 [Flammula alnicola]
MRKTPQGHRCSRESRTACFSSACLQTLSQHPSSFSSYYFSLPSSTCVYPGTLQHGSTRMSYNGRYVHDLTLRGEAPAGPSTTPNADGGSQWLNPDIMDTPARVRMGRIHTSWQHRQNDLSTPVADGFSQAITRKTALDDVVNPTADSLFSPAQDINFKRDFGEWFQPDDAVTPYGMLERRASLGASHNSDERRDPPRCLSGTRDLVLKKIMDWLQSGSDSKIMWMYGRAGAGKSAIAQTIADLCSAKQLLAASFFWFRAAHGRNDETRVISTLAYQLVLEIPEIRRLVEKAIEEDSLLLSRPLEKQLEDLIIKPLNKMVLTKKNAISLPFRPRFIILDGLDECGTPSAPVSYPSSPFVRYK